jgi:hypothetical protein
MKVLRHLYSALLASDFSRDSGRGGTTVGLTRRVIQNGLIGIIRWTAVVGGSLSLLFGSSALAQSVSLAWNADTDPTVVGYNVHYGTSSTSLTKTQNAGTATTATVSGLTTGQIYYFAVSAYNAAGVNSAYSNEVSYTPTATSPTPTHVAKDFNGDGYADLVWNNTSTGEVAIWFLKNGVIASGSYLPTMPLQWRIAGVGDFNGDGNADLVWENTSTGQRSIWFLKNGVLSSTTYLPTVAVQWHIAGVGDFNGDGFADLVWENTTTGERANLVPQKRCALQQYLLTNSRCSVAHRGSLKTAIKRPALLTEGGFFISREICNTK